MLSFVLITPTRAGALRLLRARGAGLGYGGAGSAGWPVPSSTGSPDPTAAPGGEAPEPTPPN